jgi:hypothetical protein
VVPRLTCAECGTHSDEQAKGWRTYHAVEELTDDDYLLSFCPACAMREFGSLRTRRAGDRETS